jgi:hypothetical protein
MQNVFEQLVLNPEHPEASKWLKSVALAFWYESFVPATANLSSQQVAQAGFVLDKLSRYSCTPILVKEQVRDVVLPALKQRNNALSTTSKDQLAQLWAADCDLKQSFKLLLPYQKRHYYHAA